MAGLLRQLVEASQLQAIAEPWVAGARDHRIWPAGRHFHSVQDAIFAEDRQDKDRLQEGSGGIGVASPAYYVSLSRPRSFKQLLSHGLPEREIIESGPPEDIAKAFKTLFETKIAKTKIACKKAREEMNWPPRRDV